MIITAKYAATCPACRASITAGARIEWSKGSPAKHVACAGVSSGGITVSRPSPRSVSGPRGKWTGCACGSREDSHGQLIDARNNCSSCRHDAD